MRFCNCVTQEELENLFCEATEPVRNDADMNGLPDELDAIQDLEFSDGYTLAEPSNPDDHLTAHYYLKGLSEPTVPTEVSINRNDLAYREPIYRRFNYLYNEETRP